MKLITAFWIVLHRIFKWRPILMGCCDCKDTYYLTKNVVVRNLKNTSGENEPVIKCPYCGLEHLMIFVRLDPDVIGVKWEVELEDDITQLM
jgi:DNA-directed RNA polymerase subunit RPC12/RpoP